MSTHPATTSRLARSVRLRPAPLRSDLRAGSTPDVALIGGAGPYEVDVLVRRLRDGRIELVGQITGAERVHEPVCGLPIALFDAAVEACVARTETDRFGEFEIKGLAAAAYVLALGEDGDAPCILVQEGGTRAAACEAPL